MKYEWTLGKSYVKLCIYTQICSVLWALQALLYQQLVMEVVQQLTRMFKPDIKMIKKRIEHLVESEYLERDKENQQMFKYLA